MTTPWAAILIVVSDRAARGEREDETGPLLAPHLEAAGFLLKEVVVVADERPEIAAALREAVSRYRLVLTTGGTGIGPRDVTPEATRDILDLELPGLGEEMRRRGSERTPKALGSRGVAGACGRSVIVNLPGRPAGAVESFGFVSAALPHLIALRQGPVSDGSHEPSGGEGALSPPQR